MNTTISESQEGGIRSIGGYQKYPESKYDNENIADTKDVWGLQPDELFVLQNVPDYSNIKKSMKSEDERETIFDMEDLYDNYGRFNNQFGYRASPGLAVRGPDWFTPKISKQTKMETILENSTVNEAAKSFNGGYQDINNSDDVPEILIQRSRDYIDKMQKVNTIDEPAGYQQIARKI